MGLSRRAVAPPALKFEFDGNLMDTSGSNHGRSHFDPPVSMKPIILSVKSIISGLCHHNFGLNLGLLWSESGV